MIAGANAVAVGTANFMNPYACPDIKKGMISYMEKHNIDDINKIVNTVKI